MSSLPSGIGPSTFLIGNISPLLRNIRQILWKGDKQSENWPSVKQRWIIGNDIVIGTPCLPRESEQDWTRCGSLLVHAPQPLPSLKRLQRLFHLRDGQLWRSDHPQRPAGRHQVIVDGLRYATARVVWKLAHKTDPVETIDHADRDHYNHFPGNLREATTSQQSMNRDYPPGKSGHRGVHYFRGCPHRPWGAGIHVGGKKIPLGMFATLEEAVIARQMAEKEYHKEFAVSASSARSGGRQ